MLRIVLFANLALSYRYANAEDVNLLVTLCYNSTDCRKHDFYYDSFSLESPENAVTNFLLRLGLSMGPSFEEYNRVILSKLKEKLVRINENALKLTGNAASDNNLLQLFKNHNDNVYFKFQNYVAEYDQIFSRYRNTNVSLLELGVRDGGSLQIWKKYFGQQSTIHGIDINSKVCDLELGEGISTFCFNVMNETLWLEHTMLHTYDIIIDDGSHVNSNVIKTFKVIFPYLNIGGIYVIEDTRTSYWQRYGGGYKAPNSIIEYFKNMIDIMHIYHYAHTQEDLAGFTEYHVYCVKFIRQIIFADGLIMVHKNKRSKDQVYLPIVGGKVAPISSKFFSIAGLDNGYDNMRHLTETL